MTSVSALGNPQPVEVDVRDTLVHAAIGGLHVDWPLPLAPLLGLFRGLVPCRVDDCDRAATGVHQIGALKAAVCPRHLAELATGRLVRRTP